MDMIIVKPQTAVKPPPARGQRAYGFRREEGGREGQ
jgi:hypothetical protein